MIEDLKRRGLVRQTTFDRLEGPMTFYIGFDPTADSLHVGHLIALTAAKRLIQAGGRAIIVIGDSTAAIGDPSGKRSARPMLSRGVIFENASAIEIQIKGALANETADGHVMFLRNSDWFEDEMFLDFVSEVGSCFSINVMLRADCFKARLEDGLSFLELSYMLMQAYDFLHLNLEHRCSLQVGGDDQWSNILAGVDLIRRKSKANALAGLVRPAAEGMTLPLLVNSDGTKMGKTEKGTVWLSPAKTSPNDFFQFWRNLPDDKVGECFRFLSFLPTNVIDVISLATPDDINAAKKQLAFELTEMVHGTDEAKRAAYIAESVFEAGDAAAAEERTVPGGIDILDALTFVGFAKSRTDARHLVAGGGVSINDVVIKDHTYKVTESVILRKGKKYVKRLKVEP